MKVLISPMSAMAETAGTFSRTLLLTNALQQANIEVAICAAKDINYKTIEDVKNYDLTIPVPLGLPKIIGVHVFPLVQKLGLTSKKTVNSFEEVLHLTGNTNYRYLKKSIEEVRKAIQKFNPDVVYSEFNISAIIAGKLENKKVWITASIPTQSNYCTMPQYAVGLNKILKEYGLPQVKSSLDLFTWADKRFVPSCYELEPFQDKNIIFCGSFKKVDFDIKKDRKQNKILVYMGNGTISQRKMQKEVTAAFYGSKFSVYIAGRGLTKQTVKNIHIAPYFDFQKYLPETVLFINHGGQNSVIDGLLYGVPQLICPGKVFERKYNAKSIVHIGAGVEIADKDFNQSNIKTAFKKISSMQDYQDNSAKIGKVLSTLGGTEKVIEEIDKAKFIKKI